MRHFPLFLLLLFSAQLTGPAICVTHCEETIVSSCCEGKQNSDCEITTAKEKNIHTTVPSSKLPECCTPCCAMPMFCCYVEELRYIDFSLAPVAIKATIPSNNGRPVSGYLSDCWQPPEWNS